MKKKRFVVLGAGITGLSLAWYLKKRWGDNATITVIEKNSQVGGWIQTLEKEGFLFEQGPRSCRIRRNESTTLTLIEALNLQHEVITPSKKAQKKYLWNNGSLKKMPSSMLGALFHPLTRKVLLPCIKELFQSEGKLEDESVYNFFSRHFGTSFTNQFIDPLVSGIYAGDMHRLSIKACFPQFYEAAKSHGSVLRGMLMQKKDTLTKKSPFVLKMEKEALFSFKKGMHTLPLALYNTMKENVLLSTELTSLQLHSDNIHLTLSDGQQLLADHCFSTLPAEALLPLLTPSAPSALKTKLSSLQRSSVALVSLGYQQSVLKYKGFGYLIPEKEKEEILGAVWDSTLFPEQQSTPDTTCITVMLGGSRMPHILEKTDGDLALMALNAVSKHLNINNLPHTLHVTRTVNAIPQYAVGHDEEVKEIESMIHSLSPHLTIAGTSFYGVAINDCILTAKKLSAKISP